METSWLGRLVYFRVSLPERSQYGCQKHTVWVACLDIPCTTTQDWQTGSPRRSRNHPTNALRLEAIATNGARSQERGSRHYTTIKKRTLLGAPGLTTRSGGYDRVEAALRLFCSRNPDRQVSRCVRQVSGKAVEATEERHSVRRRLPSAAPPLPSCGPRNRSVLLFGFPEISF